MTVHWWLPGSVPGCHASIMEDFTAEPDRLTCEICAAGIADPGYRDLVERRAADVMYKIDHRLYPWDTL